MQPLNLSLLESMFGDDADLRYAILQEFANSADAYLLELECALGGRRPDGLRSLAHKLKSSSRTVGAVNLADICDAMERAVPNRDWGLLEGLAVQLKQSLAEVLIFIKEFPEP